MQLFEEYSQAAIYTTTTAGRTQGTIDFDSLDDNAVTVRERDTQQQIRVPIDGLIEALAERLPGV